MGRGAKPYENRVRKQLTDYPRTANGDGGGSPQGKEVDKCLFSIKESVRLSGKNNMIKVNDPVALIPVGKNTLDIFINNSRVQEFTGPERQAVLDCIAEDYKYTGMVASITEDGNEVLVNVAIHGHGR